MQDATGMKIVRYDKTIMEDLNKYKKATDAGGIGTPRSGEEGLVEQGPSTSLSGNCEQGTSISQDEQTSEKKERTTSKELGEVKEQDMYMFMSASEGDNSDTSEWLPFPTSKGISGKKRDRQSSSEENVINNPRKRISGETLQESEELDSMEEYLNNQDLEPPPPSKSAKKPPTVVELAKGMKEMTTADMITLIINRAKTSEKIAAKSKNFKGNLKRYIREGAGIQKAAATELAKRVSATGETARLEQENLRLRAKLHELEERLEKMEGNRPRSPEKKIKERKESRRDIREYRICPSPTGSREVGDGVSSRTRQRERETSIFWRK